MSDLYTWCQNNGEFGQQLLSEWVGLDENSNIIDIHKIGSGSTMKVKWHCPKCNYEWIKRICDRTYFKYGCKECSKNKRIKQGINDLYTWCQNNGEYGKRLLSEWMGLDENNNSVEIHNIAKGSSKEVKWQCQRCNNIWIAPVFRRTSGICGCKICSAALKSNVVNQNQVTIEDNTLYAWCLQNGIGALTQATEPSGARGVPSKCAVMPCAIWRCSAKGGGRLVLPGPPYLVSEHLEPLIFSGFH